MTDVDERVALNCLADLYGALLTPNRREVIRLYCEEDLSFGEIADQLGISRQAAADALKKARLQLEAYEEKLALLSRTRAIGRQARRCIELLSDPDAGADDARLEAARQILRDILEDIEIE